MANGDSFQKRVSGDPLHEVYKAPFHNALVEGIKRDKASQSNLLRKALQEFKDADRILVKNDSGSDRTQYEILGLDVPLILPTENETEFKRQVAMRGVLPNCNHAGKFCILERSIPAGEIGPAIISGFAQVKLHVDDEDFEWAEVRGGRADVLSVSSLGTAFIIWKESGLGEKWAIVRLSNPQDFFCSSSSSSSESESSGSTSGSSSSTSSSSSGSSSDDSSSSSSSSGSSSGSSSSSSSSGSSSSSSSSSSGSSSSSSSGSSSSSSSSGGSSSSSSSDSSSGDGACVFYGPAGSVNSEGALCLPKYSIAIVNGELVCTHIGEDCFKIPCDCSSSSSSSSSGAASGPSATDSA